MTAIAADRPKVTEAQFQRQVLQLAKLCGWRSAHFRPAQNGQGQWRTAVAGDGKGFPDLVLVRETVLFVELKVGKNRLTPDQVAWRDALQAAGANWHLWTDDDWPAIEQTLKRTPHERPAVGKTP
ncbi:MAG: VRR-NUC domain-containing protein [Pigmentiphaga sp.]|nr:VRR-NUC domain-containing protein [Pigmentiphaga sp.]